MSVEERLASLTEAERAALRLFHQHSDPKLIARALGISVSAVDKRLMAARRKLGVGRSFDAALLLAGQEGTGKTVQVASFAAGPATPPESNTASSERSIGRRLELLPTRARPWNTLPPWARLAVMAGIVLALVVAMLVVASVQREITQAVGRS